MGLHSFFRQIIHYFLDVTDEFFFVLRQIRLGAERHRDMVSEENGLIFQAAYELLHFFKPLMLARLCKFRFRMEIGIEIIDRNMM